MASSGDLLADRRYAYAEAAFKEGDHEAAADLARQTLELAPGFAAAWFLLGQAHETRFRALGSGAEASADFRDAVAAFESAAAADFEDTLGARLRLATLGVGDPSDAMSSGYVRALFDEYATRFDRHLGRSLRYRAPALLHDAVRRACSGRGRPFRFGHALDLGCGTGLAAEAFRGECGVIAGVDLSPAMVAKAERKRLYDELAVGDLVAWLATRPAGMADLALAADVLVYLGDLRPVFAEVARVLAPGGLFALTVQAHARDGVALGQDLRYAHGEAYLDGLAGSHRFSVLVSEAVTTRQDRGENVPGRLLIISR